MSYVFIGLVIFIPGADINEVVFRLQDITVNRKLELHELGKDIMSKVAKALARKSRRDRFLHNRRLSIISGAGIS